MSPPRLRSAVLAAALALVATVLSWVLGADAWAATPVATDDVVVTQMNTAVPIDVLANDTDADGDPLFVGEVTTAPTHGTAEAGESDVTYTPDLGYVGPDSFQYEACDFTTCDVATVTVTVQPTGGGGNGPPQAIDDATTTPQDTPVTIDVLANDTDPDGDPLAVGSVTQPGHGTATIEADDTVIYAPALGFTGGDSFTYDACDDAGPPLCDAATVSVTVAGSGGGSPPDAADDEASTTKGDSVTIDVLANDSDSDGDALTVANIGTPGNGTATVNDDGTITYEPEAHFDGLDSFTYDACDPTSLCDTATVIVTVSAADDGNGGGNGGGGGGGGEGNGGGGNGTQVEGESLAFTGRETTGLFLVTLSLIAFGLLLFAAGRRIEDRARGPLAFERYDDGGFLIFRA